MKTVLKTEKETEEFKNWTYGLLRDPQVENLCITFTKKDGTERKMFCTLAESKIPSDKLPKSETEATSQITGSAVRVFDTELSEWRSFRWDSVTKVEFSIGS
jgi:hypothetical protein